MLITLLRVTFGELIFDIILFPFWWYSFGAAKTFLWTTKSVADEFTSLNIALWLKNIFTPMYGQYDLQGRLISFFMRIVQILGRFVFFIIWTALVSALYIAYLILPPTIIYFLIIL